MFDESLLFSIKLSLQVSIIATFFVAIFGCIIGYILATKIFYGKILIETIITLPIVLPPTVLGYYLIIIFGKYGIIGSLIFKLTGFDILFSRVACILAAFTTSLPLMIKTTESAIKSIDKKMIETSYILGYSEIETIIKIIFPLAKKGIIAGIILSFSRAIGEFGATLMLAGNIPGKTNTIPITIYSLITEGDNYNANFLALVLTLFSIIFLYLTNKLTLKNKF